MVPSARVVNHSGMFLHPRVVGGALEGQIESDLQAEASSALNEAVEVREVASSGWMASWPPSGEPMP